MSDRKAFSEILEKLHQGRSRRTEDTATESRAVNSKQKAVSKGASKENPSKATRGQDKGHEKCKNGARANEQPKSLDCGDLAQRYGELQLTKINAVVPPSCEQACRAPPDASMDPSKGCSPRESQVGGQR